MSLGVNFDYPGVKVTEADRGAIPVDLLSFRAIKMVGTALRGPTGVYGPITRSAQYREVFGNRVTTSHLDDAITSIFQNCDTSTVWVNRVVGAGNAKASQTLQSPAGVQQVETATVVGTITLAGNAEVIVTAAGMAGSPKTVSVAVLLGDSAGTIAAKIRAALAADAAINALFAVSGAGAAVILTKVVPAANDATLNIAIDNDTCTGITPAPTSANTTAGSAGTEVLKVEALGPGTDYNFAASPAHGISVKWADGDLYIYDAGVLAEVWHEVTFDNPYQTAVINGASNLIQLTWLDETQNPGDLSAAMGLGGGADGAAVTADDIAGDDQLGTGVWAFANKNTPIGFILAPGYPEAQVGTALIAMAELWRHLAIIDSTPGLNVAGAFTERNQYASSHGYAVYCYGGVKVQDPLTRAIITVPRSPFRAAHIARSHTQPGFLANVGAGLDYTLRGALALETGLMDDLTQGTLNVKGIDCARNFNSFGQGIVSWAARTISTNPLYRFLQVRVILNVIAESIEIGLRPYVFRPYDGRGRLAAEMKTSINELLWDLWNTDTLFGGTPGEAFLVKNVSTLQELELGIVQIEVYVKPTPVVERINVGLFRVPLNFDFNTGQVTIGDIESRA